MGRKGGWCEEEANGVKKWWMVTRKSGKIKDC